jgi:hypothetical protein
MIGDTFQAELSGVLCELLEIYQQHVKLASQLLPWYQGDPQYMLMIEAKQCSTNRTAKGSASPVRRSWMGLIEVKEGRRQRAEFAIKTDPNAAINDMSATGLNQLHDFLSFWDRCRIAKTGTLSAHLASSRVYTIQRVSRDKR